MPTSTRPVRIIPLQHPSTTSSSSSASSSTWAALSRWKSKVQSMTWVEWLEVFLPCTRWIRTYKWREYLQVDLMAGITVGVMLVPQVEIAFSFVFPFLVLVVVLCLVAEKMKETKRKFWALTIQLNSANSFFTLSWVFLHILITSFGSFLSCFWFFKLKWNCQALTLIISSLFVAWTITFLSNQTEKTFLRCSFFWSVWFLILWR